MLPKCRGHSIITANNGRNALKGAHVKPVSADASVNVHSEMHHFFGFRRFASYENYQLTDLIVCRGEFLVHYFLVQLHDSAQVLHVRVDILLL